MTKNVERLERAFKTFNLAVNANNSDEKHYLYLDSIARCALGILVFLNEFEAKLEGRPEVLTEISSMLRRIRIPGDESMEHS